MKTEYITQVTIPVKLMENKGVSYLLDMIDMVTESEKDEHNFKKIEFVGYNMLEGDKAKHHPQFSDCVTFELKFIVE